MMVTDASVWVSSMHTDIHNRATVSWLQECASTGDNLIAPNLLLAEVGGAVARLTGRSRLGRVALRRLESYTFLQIVAIDSKLASIAADLAIDYRLRGADAVYAALAYALNIPLVTWDQEQMTRVQNVVRAGVPGTVFGSNGHSTTPP
jgi:predicted nucleic acid-binding protein